MTPALVLAQVGGFSQTQDHNPYGNRVSVNLETVAERIGRTHLTYAQGAAAGPVAAATIVGADLLHLPVSTTHVLSSGVAGALVANGSGAQEETVRKIFLAGVLTPPASMFLAGLLFAAGWQFVGCHRRTLCADRLAGQLRLLTPRQSLSQVADQARQFRQRVDHLVRAGSREPLPHPAPATRPVVLG